MFNNIYGFSYTLHVEFYSIKRSGGFSKDLLNFFLSFTPFSFKTSIG